MKERSHTWLSFRLRYSADFLRSYCLAETPFKPQSKSELEIYFRTRVKSKERKYNWKIHREIPPSDSSGVIIVAADIEDLMFAEIGLIESGRSTVLPLPFTFITIGSGVPCSD
jgi:hypothetical protein